MAVCEDCGQYDPQLRTYQREDGNGRVRLCAMCLSKWALYVVDSRAMLERWSPQAPEAQVWIETEPPQRVYLFRR